MNCRTCKYRRLHPQSYPCLNCCSAVDDRLAFTNYEPASLDYDKAIEAIEHNERKV